jgi:hypothetical protein
LILIQLVCFDGVDLICEGFIFVFVFADCGWWKEQVFDQWKASPA